MNLEALKQLKNVLPYSTEKFTQFIESHTEGLDSKRFLVDTIVEEVEMTVFDEITVDELLETTTLVATQNIQNDINFDKLAARLHITSIYRDALSDYHNATSFEKLYRNTFKKYIAYGVESKLLSEKMMDEMFDLDELSNALVPQRDDLFMYIAIDTAWRRYMKLDWNQKPLETPQFMWMRIAMWMSINEEDPTTWAKNFYEKLSKLEYIPGGSTNIGAGTNYATLSNCYLIDTEDDTDAIFDNIKSIAMISKATGGIGISVSKLRASGSPVKSNNTFSTGPIPFVKVMDTTLKSMARAGKKHGAMAVYMENWHLDFPDFIDLRQNAGDDYRRVRTANTAVYISDEFMKRVINNDTWYLFDPADVPELTELYGNEFSQKYSEYCELAEQGKMRTFKTVPAREQLKRIMASLLGTSHPWLTWKDNINLRALNNNTGTIHSSNLCTEICLPQDRENIAVCNLAYVNLAKHVVTSEDGDKSKTRIDWDRLEETVRITQRHLDNLVDVNDLNVKEAKKSDSENRAVGMGLSGLADVLEKFGFPYDSGEAFNLTDRVMEFITYHSIDESCNLSDDRGAYQHFDGSMWSKGYVPFDTIEKMSQDRHGKVWEGEIAQTDVKNGVSMTLKTLKNRIESKLDNAKNEEDVELYEMFNQLATFIENSANKITDDSRDTVEGESEEALLQPGRGYALRQDRSITLDWDTLRERVKGGIRNATTMAIAPNASTGLVLGTTPGIDIRFSQVFSRQTSRGKFLDINHNLVKDLEKEGIWEDVKEELIMNYGDIQSIDSIPDHIKRIYKTSFQVSPYAAIEVASRAQKWIDQAMSRNMYLATRDIDELIDIYVEAWRRGIKTTYYLHTKPRHKSEQSTTKVNKREETGQSGFGGVSSQISLDGKEEKKGFGFVEEKKETQKELVETTVPKTSGQGFGAVRTSEVEEKAQFKKTPKKISIDSIGQACPLDPAERALCEACQ